MQAVNSNKDMQFIEAIYWLELFVLWSEPLCFSPISRQRCGGAAVSPHTGPRGQHRSNLQIPLPSAAGLPACLAWRIVFMHWKP